MTGNFAENSTLFADRTIIPHLQHITNEKLLLRGSTALGRNVRSNWGHHMLRGRAPELYWFNPVVDRFVIEEFTEGHFRRKRGSAPEAVFLRNRLT
jgi:hypothetical protein